MHSPDHADWNTITHRCTHLCVYTVLIVIKTNTRINQLIKNSNHEDPFEIQGKMIFK